MAVAPTKQVLTGLCLISTVVAFIHAASVIPAGEEAATNLGPQNGEEASGVEQPPWLQFCIANREYYGKQSTIGVASPSPTVEEAEVTTEGTQAVTETHQQPLPKNSVSGVPQALPQNAPEGQLKWQPSLDFDTDGCYNTPAIDAQGNVAEGQDHHNTGGAEGCRDEGRLDNNNVYVRVRCNNNWCAYVYDYYFEKDVAVQHVRDVGGHRHDWEHIIVFVEGDEAKIVAVSEHGDYITKNADQIRWDDTHPKVVYHKNGPSTHSFRFANEGDDNIENHKGVWFRGALVDYNSFPNDDVRNKLMAHNFGKASIAINDQNIKKQIDYARNGGAPGFDSGKDQ